MMRCKKCMLSFPSRLAGQGFTEWTCKICGKKFTHGNTDTPKVCKECSKKYHVCTDCGEAIIDNA